MKRYQECNILIKIWRRRYYLSIPFRYLHTRIKYRKSLTLFDKSVIWGNLIGEAQCNMKWTYTSTEVKATMQKRLSDKKSKDRSDKLKKLGL